MKKGFTLVTLICLVVVAVLSISCSKSDDPADNDLFVGKYHGTISYTVDYKPKIVDNGTVTVIKIGNSYNFVFSDGIPDIKDVKFKKQGDHTLVNIDFKDGIKAINITASRLSIVYRQDVKTWTAIATR